MRKEQTHLKEVQEMRQQFEAKNVEGVNYYRSLRMLEIAFLRIEKLEARLKEFERREQQRVEMEQQRLERETETIFLD